MTEDTNPVTRTGTYTATVALVTFLDVRGKFRSFSNFLLSSILLLLGLSLLCRLLGVGTAIDVGIVWQPENLTGNPLMLLWILLSAYFRLYHAVTFCVALACGIYLGYRHAKAAEARENAARENPAEENAAKA